jgi:predicted TIM-barrel fold metal-dependent hydrolase
MIDSQLHILDPKRFPYRRSAGGYFPRDDEVGDLPALLKVMDDHGITRGVLVQPSTYGTDNAAILDGLDRYPQRFRAVVMAGPDVAAYAARPGVAGARLNLTDFAAHTLESACELGRAILASGLLLQVQARPLELARFLPALPAGPVVIDHLGRVDPSDPREIDCVAALSGRPNTWLKVSGGFRLGGGRDWPAVSGALHGLVGAFTPQRLLWGSDWPFINLQGGVPSYAETLVWGRALTDLDRASKNAARLFGFDHE